MRMPLFVSTMLWVLLTAGAGVRAADLADGWQVVGHTDIRGRQAVLSDGRGLICGFHYDRPACQIWNPTTGSITPGPVPGYDHGDNPAMAVDPQGAMWLVGGRAIVPPPRALVVTERWRSDASVWQRGESLPSGVANGKLVFLPDGTALLFDGESTSGGARVCPADVLVKAPYGTRWEPFRIFKAGICVEQVVALDADRVLVHAEGNEGAYLATWDRRTKSSTPIGALVPRGAHLVALGNGRFAFVHERTRDEANPGTMWVIDLLQEPGAAMTRTLEPCFEVTHPRAVGDDRVLIVGRERNPSAAESVWLWLWLWRATDGMLSELPPPTRDSTWQLFRARSVSLVGSRSAVLFALDGYLLAWSERGSLQPGCAPLQAYVESGARLDSYVFQKLATAQCAQDLRAGRLPAIAAALLSIARQPKAHDRQVARGLVCRFMPSASLSPEFLKWAESDDSLESEVACESAFLTHTTDLAMRSRHFAVLADLARRGFPIQQGVVDAVQATPALRAPSIPVLRAANEGHASGYDELHAAVCAPRLEPDAVPGACRELPANAEALWRREPDPAFPPVLGYAFLHTALAAGAVGLAYGGRRDSSGRAIATGSGLIGGALAGGFLGAAMGEHFCDGRPCGVGWFGGFAEGGLAGLFLGAAGGGLAAYYGSREPGASRVVTTTVAVIPYLITAGYLLFFID